VGRVFAGGFFLFISLSLVMPSFGAEPPEPVRLRGDGLALSLDEAVRRGLEENIDLKKKLIDLSTAEYASKNLWAEFFPGISAGAGITYGTGLFGGDGFELDRSGLTLETSAGVSLTLTAGISQTMKIVKLAGQIRLLDYEDARRQLEIGVTRNFYTLIADRENLSHLEKNLELAERQLERDRIAFNNGLRGELAFLQSRLGVETAKYDLSNARTAHANGMGEFLALLGIPRDTPVLLEGKLDIHPIDAEPEALIREYLPKRPDILGQRQVIENLEYTEKQTALNARAPSLSLSARWSGQLDPFTDRISGTASVSIPIDSWIPGTGRDQAVKSAGANIEKARLDLQDIEKGAAAQIRSLTARLRDSWASIEIARLSVEIAERTYELHEQGFQLGTVESLALEDTRNSLAEKRQQLLRSELSYQTMMLDLAAALNVDWKNLRNLTGDRSPAESSAGGSSPERPPRSAP
jgi:multidrug efflux system outer membrane protein